jgi:hypothetical protein
MIFLLATCILTGSIFEDSDSLIVISDTLTICGDHEYACKVHITDHSLVLIRQWQDGSDSLGRLMLRAPLIVIDDSSLIQGSFRGYGGGDNSNPHGSGPGSGGAGNPGGGGGAGYGGAGGQGGDTAPGSGGSPYGESGDTLIEQGSGGGAGRLGSVDGLGGTGGAGITLRAQTITIDNSDIETHGEPGHDGGLEAGGGGAGGGVMIWGDTVRVYDAQIGAHGGGGGNAAFGGGGGAGGGRIKIFYDSVLDSARMLLTVQEGTQGSGAYGTPEPGKEGSVHIRRIIGIQEKNDNIRCPVQIWPSLTRGIVSVHSAVALSIMFYDCTGRCVKHQQVTRGYTSVDLADLSPGVYFIYTNTMKKIAGKVIVLK